jgi:hypothetical protein
MRITQISPLVIAATFLAQTSTQPKSRILFEQPSLSAIAGNFHVPISEHGMPKAQPFNLILWQPNPNRADGELVPTAAPLGDKTGFFPSVPLTRYQLAYTGKPNSTGVQAQGDTVGVYLNSADLPDGSDKGMNKMMITPEYALPADTHFRPFADTGARIVYHFDLQIPTAVSANKPGNFVYAVQYLVFADRTSKTKLTFEVALFHHAPTNPPPPAAKRLQETEVGAFDEPSQTFQVGNPLSPLSRLNTPLPGSTLYGTQPWTGWRPYAFAITRENFAAGLAALAAQGSGFHGSANPADWELQHLHLNAELKFGTGPAQMGWSMRRERITWDQQ